MARTKEERRRVWTCMHCGLQTITATQMARHGVTYESPEGWFLGNFGDNVYCSRWCAANSASEPA